MPAGFGEGEVVALIAESVLLPGADDDVEAFVEVLGVELGVTSVTGGSELGRGAGVEAPGDAEVDAAVGEVVEEGDALGDTEGVPVGKDGAALADPEPAAVLNEARAHEDGVGGGAIPAVPGEVVFGEPEAGEAALVDESYLLVHFVHQGVPGVLLSDVVVGGAVEPHLSPLLGRNHPHPNPLL